MQNDLEIGVLFICHLCWIQSEQENEMWAFKKTGVMAGASRRAHAAPNASRWSNVACRILLVSNRARRGLPGRGSVPSNIKGN